MQKGFEVFKSQSKNEERQSTLYTLAALFMDQIDDLFIKADTYKSCDVADIRLSARQFRNDLGYIVAFWADPLGGSVSANSTCGEERYEKTVMKNG